MIDVLMAAGFGVVVFAWLVLGAYGLSVLRGRRAERRLRVGYRLVEEPAPEVCAECGGTHLVGADGLCDLCHDIQLAEVSRHGFSRADPALRRELIEIRMTEPPD